MMDIFRLGAKLRGDPIPCGAGLGRPSCLWEMRKKMLDNETKRKYRGNDMKLIKPLTTIGCAVALAAGVALAGEAAKPEAKPTCCQKAAAEGKDCAHPCCVEAHKAGKSCEKCNPNKEDLNLKKKEAKKDEKK